MSKFVYQTGGVKDLSEAFKDLPVEEEWHKGKIENVLSVEETEEIYKVYEIGDIVFTGNYKYADGRNGSNHLFVIIDKNNFAVPIENFGMLLSSRIEKIKYKSNILLEKDNKNNLKENSIVKKDVIYKLFSNNILFKIGEVDRDKIEEYKQKYIESKKSED